jgi:hypothetical protein
MKRILLPFLVLTVLATACAPKAADKTEGLPAARPADFEVRFKELGAPSEPYNEYLVSSTVSSFKEVDGIQEKSWAFKTDTAALSELYTAIRDYQVALLKSEEEQGSNPDRFGYRLEIVCDGKRYAVADQGREYIQKEGDYNRFMDAIATVRQFVGDGIADQMQPVKATLVLDAKAPRPDSLEMHLEQLDLLELLGDSKPGDTLRGESSALMGVYEVTAHARVGAQAWDWKKVIDMGEGLVHIHLRLGKAGFEEFK